jgi:hypothetical protein
MCGALVQNHLSKLNISIYSIKHMFYIHIILNGTDGHEINIKLETERLLKMKCNTCIILSCTI